MPIINMVYKKKKWWKPWANTIAYYPLETDTNDYSNNSHNWINYWTTFTTLSSGKKVWVFNGSAYIQIPDAQDMRGGNQWTMWVYLKKSSWWNVALDPFSKWVDSSYSSIVWRVWLRSDIINVIGYWINPSNNTNKPTYTWATVLDWNWHHLIWTFNNWIYKLYWDWNLLQTQDYSSNSYSFSSTWDSYISWSRNPYESQVTYKRVWNMSEMIIENKARTAQEVSDYYNLTKSNYWY